MEFVDAKTHKSLNKSKPKCLINWIRTIQSAKVLWEMLQKCDFKYLNLKYLNQDPIENLFGQIRDHGHRNVNPSPYLFGTAFKAILTCNLTSKHSVSANCQEDKEDIQPLLSFLQAEEISETDIEETNVECNETAIPNTSFTHFDTLKIINILKIKMKIECTQCMKLLQDNNTTEVLKHIIEIAEMRFSTFCHETNVKRKLIHVLTEIFPKFHCPEIQNNMLNSCAQQFLMEWCNFINKILKGSKQEDLNTNYMYYQAQRMSLKYCRNKSKK